MEKTYTSKLIDLKKINLNVEDAQKMLDNYINSFKEAGYPMLGEIAKKNTNFTNLNLYMEVKLDNVCIEYIKLWIQDNSIWGEYKPSNNLLGKRIKYILEVHKEVKPIFTARIIKYDDGENYRDPKLIAIDLFAFKRIALKNKLTKS